MGFLFKLIIYVEAVWKVSMCNVQTKEGAIEMCNIKSDGRWIWCRKAKWVQNCFRVHGEQCGACDWIYLVVASAANEDPWSDLASTIPPAVVALSDPRLAVRLNETFCPDSVEDEAADGAQSSKYDPTSLISFS